ncbi:MAG TPA: DUF4097 family beta strand repeat-containing protein [Microlunatus sp.]
MYTFATTAPISAHLDIPAGGIRLIAADRADTTVEVLPTDASKARDVKAAEQITVTYSDGALQIEAPSARHQILGPSGSVEIAVQLPVGSSIEVKTASTEFRGVGTFGDVTIDAAQGAIKVDEAQSVRATVAAGDIIVGRLNGPAELSTQKGDIQISEAVGGTVVMQSMVGNLTIGAAAGVSASLDAGVTVGRIHNSLSNADGAAAALNIRATTTTGDVVARSL